MGQEPTILYCVGATKAGTSWLYSYLRDHPEAHLRSIKELHYFDDAQQDDADWHARQLDNRLLRVSEDLAGASEAERPALEAEIRDCAELAALHRGPRPDLEAYRAYLTGGIGDEQLVADLTPAYALLPEETFRLMAGAARNTRFIYILRDPVARLWSHIRMNAARRVSARRDLEARANRIFWRFGRGRHPGIWARSDYRGTIERLSRALSPRRLLILFYEELFSEAAIATLCDFLGIGYRPARLKAAVNEGPELRMDANQLNHARQWMADQYAYVSEKIDHLPEAWQANMVRATA